MICQLVDNKYGQQCYFAKGHVSRTISSMSSKMCVLQIRFHALLSKVLSFDQCQNGHLAKWSHLWLRVKTKSLLALALLPPPLPLVIYQYWQEIMCCLLLQYDAACQYLVRFPNPLLLQHLHYTIFLCIWDDQHRNPNMNNKDHNMIIIQLGN